MAAGRRHPAEDPERQRSFARAIVRGLGDRERLVPADGPLRVTGDQVGVRPGARARERVAATVATRGSAGAPQRLRRLPPRIPCLPQVPAHPLWSVPARTGSAAGPVAADAMARRPRSTPPGSHRWEGTIRGPVEHLAPIDAVGLRAKLARSRMRGGRERVDPFGSEPGVDPRGDCPVHVPCRVPVVRASSAGVTGTPPTWPRSASCWAKAECNRSRSPNKSSSYATSRSSVPERVPADAVGIDEDPPAHRLTQRVGAPPHGAPRERPPGSRHRRAPSGGRRAARLVRGGRSASRAASTSRRPG